MLLQRTLVFVLLISAPAMPALAQAVAQPNRPADVSSASPATTPAHELPPTSSTETQRLIRAVKQQPGDAAAVAAPVATQPAAEQVNPKEKLVLGRGSSAGASNANPVSPDANVSWVLSTLTALGVVVGLILLLRAGLSKITGQSVASSHNPVIEVLTRTSVAPKNHVLLLRLGRRILVVGDSAAGLQTLADIEDPEEVASLLQSITAAKAGSATSGFSETLDTFDGQYEEMIDPHAHGGDGGEHRADRARDGVVGLLSRIRSAGKGAGR